MKEVTELSRQLGSALVWRWWIDLLRNATLSDFVRKVIETFATRVLLLIIGLATSVVVARILGPEGRGAYAVATVIGSIGVQLGNLGLHASNTYYVAQDRGLLPKLIANTVLVSFGFGGIAAASAGIVFVFLPDLAPIHGFLLVLSLVWIPLGLAFMLLQNLLLGLEEVRQYNTIEVLNKVVSVGLIGLLVIFSAVTVERVFSVGLIALALTLMWILITLSRRVTGSCAPSVTLLKQNLGYGLRAYWAALFAFIALRFDLVIIQYILGSEQAGYYSIATVLADMVYMLPVVAGTILFSKLSAMQDEIKKWEFTKSVIKIIGLVMIGLSSIAALFAGPIISLFYGIDFLPAAPAFIYLLPGIVLLSFNTLIMNYLGAIGMPPVVVYSPGLAAITNVALNMKLIPAFGIVGASMSLVLSSALMLMLISLYVFRFNKYRMAQS